MNQMVAVVKTATISLEVSFVIVKMDMSLLIKHIVVVSFSDVFLKAIIILVASFFLNRY